MEETIVVSKKEYESLKRLELLMLWFEVCDVALTWSKYDEAYELYSEDLAKDEEETMTEEEKMQLQLFV